MFAFALSSTSFKTALPRHTVKRTSHNVPKCALPDVVIVGGGPAGLTTALELTRQGASVRVLATKSRKSNGYAAAGMIAPRAESVYTDLAKLCASSAEMFPSLSEQLYSMTGVNVNYQARGDYLRPYINESDLRADTQNLVMAPALHELEPALSSEVLGAHRLLGEAHIDNRAYMVALEKACLQLGVTIDSDAFVRRLVVSPSGQSVNGLLLENNTVVSGGHYVIATGCWSRELLPNLPIQPIKGQMICLKPPKGLNRSQKLNHVLHMENIYIVPKQDGEAFFVGATEEPGVFDPKITAGGIAQLIQEAVRLVPSFADYEIAETWCGFRPATPDLRPVFGMSEYSNMSIATGYHRHGIILSPIGGKIAAAVASGKVANLDQELREQIETFSYERFIRSDPEPIRSFQPAQSENSNRSREDIVEEPEILLYRVMPDGTNEPVPPPRKNWKTPVPSQSGISPAVEKVPEAVPVPHPQSTSPSAAVHNNSPSIQQASSSTGVAKTESDNAGDDAYEDVMQFRGEEADAKMSEALAKNRAFGRPKSALEEQASTVLSLTDEEVAAFDKALEEGIEEMNEFDKTFDPNHESVIATRRALAQLEMQNAIGATETATEELDGYF